MLILMKNALTIDLEFWYSAELIRPYVQDAPDLIIEMTIPILDLLDIHKTKATFFVLGEVAEKYPDLISDIYNRGHEIASHAYSHKPLSELGRVGFENEIYKSLCLLERITGDRIKGFRAPTFSINNNTIWGLDVLEKSNFVYDSSIFPINSPLYGVPNAPLYPYHPSRSNLALEDELNGFKIIEIPLSVFKTNIINIPISGGFYLRSIPFFIFNILFKKSLKSKTNIIYLHPWEIYPISPRPKLPIYSSFITYLNIDSTLDKLNGLLNLYKFTTMEEIVEDLSLI